MPSRAHLSLMLGACAIAGCASTPPVRSTDPQTIGPDATLVAAEAAGVKLALPKDANGPFYDSDDYARARPTWVGPAWRVHFVYGNGGLTQFMPQARCFDLDDEAMRRRVCIGKYIRYGALADISHAKTPAHVTSMHVSIESAGLTEAQALDIIKSASTTWETR